MDSCTEYSGIRNMLYLATGFAADLRDVDLVRSGPFRGSAHGCDWANAAAASLPMQITLMESESKSTCLFSLLFAGAKILN